MNGQCNGELIPIGGGDPIPLIRQTLTIGRRESCDICLQYGNVSGLHCELSFRNGHWFIVDLDSTNGVKINGVRVPRQTKKVLHPKDTLAIAKRQFTIEYEAFGNEILEEMQEEEEDVLSRPLLEKAGLNHPPRAPMPAPRRAQTPLPQDED